MWGRWGSDDEAMSRDSSYPGDDSGREGVWAGLLFLVGAWLVLPAVSGYALLLLKLLVTLSLAVVVGFCVSLFFVRLRTRHSDQHHRKSYSYSDAEKLGQNSKPKRKGL